MLKDFYSYLNNILAPRLASGWPPPGAEGMRWGSQGTAQNAKINVETKSINIGETIPQTPMNKHVVY